MLLACLAACSEARYPLPGVQPELQVALSRHVLEHGGAPAEYVIGRFGDRDVVLLGEHGRIRQNVRLVQEIVPRLPAAGVARIGLEFVAATDQAGLDRIVTGDVWNEDLVREIVKTHAPEWGYREYLDLLKAAWSVNRERGELALRVVPLGGAPPDAVDALRRAGALTPGEKTLILAGFENAFTRFRLPAPGVGNLVFDEVGDRAATILLHAPWPSVLGPDAPAVYAADGHIDASMIALSERNRRAGYDVTGSAFATLGVGTSEWGADRNGLTLGDLCDGYVFQTALHAYLGVTPIEGWFDDDDRTAALRKSCDIPRQFYRYH
jgi:hypothetical protein